MKVKIKVTYHVYMCGGHQSALTSIDFPTVSITMGYRNISSSTHKFPVGSYIFPKTEITLPDNPHHCYVILKNFCQTFKSKFDGNIEKYILHCVNKLAPDFVREVNAMYEAKEMKRSDQEKINDLAASADLLTHGSRTIETEIEI